MSKYRLEKVSDTMEILLLGCMSCPVVHRGEADLLEPLVRESTEPPLWNRRRRAQSTPGSMPAMIITPLNK